MPWTRLFERQYIYTLFAFLGFILQTKATHPLSLPLFFPLPFPPLVSTSSDPGSQDRVIYGTLQLQYDKSSPRMHVKGPQISVGRGRQKNVWHLNLIFEVTCGAPFAILTMFYNVRKLIWNPKEAEKTSPPCIFYWPDGPDCGRKVFSLGEDYFIHFVKRRHMTQLLSNVY